MLLQYSLGNDEVGFKFTQLQYHLLFSALHSYELLVVPKVDKMCGDSSLCCCRWKCQRVRGYCASEMKRDPFLLLPHASQASGLRPCLCCLNGLNEWPVLVLCVWATMALWDFSVPPVYCISPRFCFCCGCCVVLTGRKFLESALF